MANLPDLKAKVKVEFTDLEAAALKAKLLGDVLKKELGGGEISKVTQDVSNGIRGIANSADSGSPAIVQLGSGLAATSSTITSAFIPALVATALVLSPVITLLGAFTVGLTAALTVMTLGAAAFGGLAAGAVALAAVTGNLGDTSGKAAASQEELAVASDKVTAAHQRVLTAQANLNTAVAKYGANSSQAAAASVSLKTALDSQSSAQDKLNALQEQGKGPLAELVDHFKELGETLGKEVAPAAREVVSWANAMLDPLFKLAAPLTTWVTSNDRLTNSLNILGDLINGFAESLTTKFGPAIGDFLDQWISRGPQWEALWRETLGKAADATQGLLTNLLRLSDWFTARLPTLGPEVQSIMGGIGNVIQGIGGAAGAVADFFITHWPDISKAAQGVFDNISTGFNYVLPLLGLAIAAFQKLDPVIQFIKDHSDALRPILFAVGGLLVVMAASAVLTGGAVLLLVAGITALASAISWVVGWIRDNLRAQLQGAGGDFSGLGYFVQMIVGHFWNLVDAARAAAGAIRDAANAASNLPVIGGLIQAATPHAGGGLVVPNSTYLVGEEGPELLVMGARSGYVFPTGSTATQAATTGNAPAAPDPRPSTMIGLLSEQNQLLRAWVQAMMTQPQPVGRWPYAGRTT